MNEYPNQSNNGQLPHAQPQGTELAPVLVGSQPVGTITSEMPSGRDDYYGEESLDWHQIVVMLRRRWKIFVATLALVVGAAVLFTLFSPSIYQATSQLLLNTNSIKSSSSQLTDVIDAMNPMIGARSQDTEVAILQSGSVQDAAQKRLADENPSLREQLGDKPKVDIRPLRSTDIITVSVFSRSPEAAIKYSKAICESYLEQNEQNNKEQYRGTAKYVQNELNAVRGRLDKAREALKNFKEENGVTDPTAEGGVRIAQLNEITSNLRQAEANYQSGIARLKELRQQAASMAPTLKNNETTVIRPIVAQLRQQLTDLQTKLFAAQQEYAPGSPELRDIEGQIAKIQAKLRAEAKTEVSSSDTIVNPVRQAIMQQIAELQGEIWADQARANALRGEVARAKERVGELPAREYQLGQLQTDVTTLEQTYSALNANLQKLLISENAPMSNARITEEAIKAEKVSPRPVRNLALSLVLGTILGLMLTMLVDRLDDRIYSEEDAQNASRLPVLTQVPLFKEAHQQSLVGQTDKPSALLESYRMLRTNIAFAGLGSDMRTVMVTSSQPNEGKSNSAANLAIVMALNEKRVILVDCDLRRPTVHKLFGLSNAKGLSSIVAGFNTLEECLLETDIPGLRILPAGPTPPNPPELLDSKACRDIIQQLSQHADFVVVDTPPAMTMADASIVASMVDGALLVVSCQEAAKREISRTSELLFQTRTKLLGTILNKTTSHMDGYYYYKSYRYRYNAYQHYGIEAPSNGKAASKESALPADSKKS